MRPLYIHKKVSIFPLPYICALYISDKILARKVICFFHEENGPLPLKQYPKLQLNKMTTKTAIKWNQFPAETT